LVTQVKGLRETFKRTWRDLGTEADIESASDRGRSSEAAEGGPGSGQKGHDTPRYGTSKDTGKLPSQIGGIKISTDDNANGVADKIMAITDEGDLINVISDLDKDESGEIKKALESKIKSTGVKPGKKVIDALKAKGIDVEVETEEKLKVAESFYGDTTLLSEAQGKADPLTMQVKLIRPGWGNSKDNHYYAKEMLSTQGEKFVGAKMYETDHKANEKSTRTWVSTIKSISCYASDGAPIAEVVAHEPNFIQRVRNLASEKLLDKLECSILAGAIAEKTPYTLDGRKGKLIKEITDVESVDWVTRAGAGGHALTIAENAANSTEEVIMPEDKDKNVTVVPAAETTQVEQVAVSEAEKPKPPLSPEKLAVEVVMSTLDKTNLPKAAKDRLGTGIYPDDKALQTAIASEVEYLKAVTGSGKPFGVGISESAAEKKMTTEEYDAKVAEIFKRHNVATGGG